MRGGGEVWVEPGFPAAALEALRARGHTVKLGAGDPAFGGYQAIGRDAAQGVYRGASDPRKDGGALGR